LSTAFVLRFVFREAPVLVCIYLARPCPSQTYHDVLLHDEEVAQSTEHTAVASNSPFKSTFRALPPAPSSTEP
jgi:hypothetical protein